jgi:hypothetical protein
MNELMTDTTYMRVFTWVSSDCGEQGLFPQADSLCWAAAVSHPYLSCYVASKANRDPGHILAGAQSVHWR